MNAIAEPRRTQPSDGDAILNALPNPVLLVGPDGKIVGLAPMYLRGGELSLLLLLPMAYIILLG